MKDFDDETFSEEFDLGGEIELDELDDAETGVEMELLMARVTAARFAGV